MMERHGADGSEWPQVPTPQQASRYWLGFGATLALLFLLIGWWVHDPGQDHIASIPLNGDGTWYHNYELGYEIQDHDIFYHGIGNSIHNAQQADIILLGSSHAVFAADWRLFDAFARKYHLKIFNLAFAGIPNGEFALRIIRKWDLQPKMWIIDLLALPGDIKTSFFYPSLQSPAFRTSVLAPVVSYSRLHAFKNVVGLNIKWRLKRALGLQNPMSAYRSAVTGNWYLDDWLGYGSDKNPRIKVTVNQVCPAPAGEVDDAKRYVRALGGGALVLTQVPSRVSCDQRVYELASALNVPAFTVDATQFSSWDGGGHLDGVSARKYTTMFFAWLEQRPEFRDRFSK